MDLQIRQTWAQLGLKTTQPQLKLQTRQPQLSMQRRDAQVECDASQAYADLGLRSPAAFSKENARKGYETVFQHIGQVARNGDMMAQITKYDMSAVVKTLAAQAMEMKQFNLGRAPNSPVDMEVIPAELKIDYHMGEIIPDLRRGALDIYTQKKGSVEIEYTGQPIYVGHNVDARA